MQESMRFRVNRPSIVNDAIDGEVVMINLDTGSYFSADTVGAAVWEAISKGASVNESVNHVAARFEGELAEIRNAVCAFVERLQREGLIVADPAAVSALPAMAAVGTPKVPFCEPKLERYDDMQDMLLADPIHEVTDAGWPNVAGKSAS